MWYSHPTLSEASAVTGDWKKVQKWDLVRRLFVSRTVLLLPLSPPVPLSVCSSVSFQFRECKCSGLMCPLHSWDWWKTFAFCFVLLFWGRLTRVSPVWPQTCCSLALEPAGLWGCRNANHAHLEALSFQPEKPVYKRHCEKPLRLMMMQSLGGFLEICVSLSLWTLREKSFPAVTWAWSVWSPTQVVPHLLFSPLHRHPTWTDPTPALIPCMHIIFLFLWEISMSI